MDWIDLPIAESFLDAMKPLAESDIPLWAVFTHASHHTNFFKWFKGKNNFFDLKVKDEHLEWDTPAEGITFYLEVLKRKYPDAMRCRRCSYCLLWGVRHWKGEDELEAFSYFRELTRKHRFLQAEDRVSESFHKILNYTKIGDI